MNGPIKAAVVGVKSGVGGVAKVIREFSLSEDLDLRCTRGWGGGPAAKAGMNGGTNGGTGPGWWCWWWCPCGGTGTPCGGGWCRQLHWGCCASPAPLLPGWWPACWPEAAVSAALLLVLFPFPVPPCRRNCLMDSTRPTFLDSSVEWISSCTSALESVAGGPPPPLVRVRDLERPLLKVMLSCP